MFALSAIAVALTLGASACGSASRGRGSSTAAKRIEFIGDTDRPERSYDADENSIHYFGHAAYPAEARAATALVKRYYAAAAAGRGRTACALLSAEIAGSVVEQYGRPPGPPELRGASCAVVMTKLFRARRRQLAAELATLQVTGVRVQGDRGYALLRWRNMPVGYTVLRREGQEWKVGVLLGGPTA